MSRKLRRWRWFGLIREVEVYGAAPRGFGYYRKDYSRCVRLVAPVPLNLLLRIVCGVNAWVRFPFARCEFVFWRQAAMQVSREYEARGNRIHELTAEVARLQKETDRMRKANFRLIQKLIAHGERFSEIEEIVKCGK